MYHVAQTFNKLLTYNRQLFFEDALKPSTTFLTFLRYSKLVDVFKVILCPLQNIQSKLHYKQKLHRQENDTENHVIIILTNYITIFLFRKYYFIIAHTALFIPSDKIIDNLHLS